LEPTILLLLVEDEAIIRVMLDDVLTEEGFALVLASEGDKALAEFEADAARFRGVVTDMLLGAGPSGWDVARRARELVPEMPIVYISGGQTHEWAAQGVPKSVLVPKPFVPTKVITAVTTLLNEADLC
jgi:DNA-binding response OmpR family regulator